MGAGAKKKKKCSRKVKSDVHVDQTLLDATVEDRRVVSTDGVERGCVFSLSLPSKKNLCQAAIGPIAPAHANVVCCLISFLIG
ncbi:hypothetical protein MKW92_011366 [Papaver armeniacum]|nr:hypothetical protein MKW92_011366 [Papaver armeniacum]